MVMRSFLSTSHPRRGDPCDRPELFCIHLSPSVSKGKANRVGGEGERKVRPYVGRRRMRCGLLRRRIHIALPKRLRRVYRGLAICHVFTIQTLPLRRTFFSFRFGQTSYLYGAFLKTLSHIKKRSGLDQEQKLLRTSCKNLLKLFSLLWMTLRGVTPPATSFANDVACLLTSPSLRRRG